MSTDIESMINYCIGYVGTLAKDKQLKERYDQFRRYGTDINALSKIVVRIHVENWFRNVSINPNYFEKDINKKRSRTRYAMSN